MNKSERYDITATHLPYNLKERSFGDESEINGVSAANCGIGAIITPRSTKISRKAVEHIARYFRREFDYDFTQYCAEEYTHPEEHRAYLWIDHRNCEYTRQGTPVDPVIGACCFRLREYEGKRPPGVPAKCYALQWIWFHPFERNHGHLSKALPYFIARFGQLIAEPPFSPAMDGFLRKYHSWPYQEDDKSGGCDARSIA
jgi:hypothetical protein